MIKMYCDSCGQPVPKDVDALCRFRFGKQEIRLDLCTKCQQRAMFLIGESLGANFSKLTNEGEVR